MVYENLINVTKDRKLKCGLCEFTTVSLLEIYDHLELVEKVKIK